MTFRICSTGLPFFCWLPTSVTLSPGLSVFLVHPARCSLFGAVSQPFKKSDIQRIVADVPGVKSVTNELKVLPLSPFDDRIRLER